MSRRDVIIIGTGPAALSAAAELHRHKLSFRILEAGPSPSSMRHRIGEFVPSGEAANDTDFFDNVGGDSDELDVSVCEHISYCQTLLNEGLLDISYNHRSLRVYRYQGTFRVHTEFHTDYQTEHLIMAMGSLSDRYPIVTLPPNADDTRDVFVIGSLNGRQALAAAVDQGLRCARQIAGVPAPAPPPIGRLDRVKKVFNMKVVKS